jgi:hypothetical protein
MRAARTLQLSYSPKCYAVLVALGVCAVRSVGTQPPLSCSNRTGGSRHGHDDASRWRDDAALASLIQSLVGFGRCDFPRTEGLRGDATRARTQQQPQVLRRDDLRRDGSGGEAVLLAQRWQRAELLRRYGRSVRVEPLRPIEVAQFGPGQGAAGESGAVDLTQFVEGMRSPWSAAALHQLFDRAAGQAVVADYAVLPGMGGLGEVSLSLGASRAGLPMHSHGESYLALVHGRKLWLVLPPSGGAATDMPTPAKLPAVVTDVFANQTALDPSLRQILGWLAAGSQDGRKGGGGGGGGGGGVEVPMLCVQEPGDVMYIPSGWRHATLNIGEALGIAGQANRVARRRRVALDHAVGAEDEHDEAADSGTPRQLVAPPSRESQLALAAALARDAELPGGAARRQRQRQRRLGVLRSLWSTAPSHLDSAERLVRALVAAAEGEEEQQQQQQQQEVEGVASRELLIHEADTVLRKTWRASGQLRVSDRDLGALRVRLCGFWADVPGHAPTATRCLLKLKLKQSLSPSVRAEFELARARLLVLQERSSAGLQLATSMVAPIANGLAAVLRMAPEHAMAARYMQVCAQLTLVLAPMPNAF